MGYLQGTYSVLNKEKYVGIKDPYYRSSWELDAFICLDKSKHIIQWGSETAIIPYNKPTDSSKRMHRYMIDLFVKSYNSKGEIVKTLIEIKPYCQTIQPKQTKRKSKKTYLTELITYQINMAKWSAAAIYAKKRKMKFVVLTERDLYR